MSEPTTQPGLTPQLCFSTDALRDFLRISRSTIDDTIIQNLNALVTPSTSGFDPTSTTHRSSSFPRRQIDPRSCTAFKDQVLFPSWSARSEVLAYCSVVATQADAQDKSSAQAVREREERERARSLHVDERLDPYSARPLYMPETRAERLAAVVRQEEGVEEIIRTRTWAAVRDRCGESTSDWRLALDEWKSNKEARRDL